MAQGSGIEWTESTWNPVTGCTGESSSDIFSRYIEPPLSSPHGGDFAARRQHNPLDTNFREAVLTRSVLTRTEESSMVDLAQAFRALAGSHGADVGTAEAWWREVESRYSEPHRRYHTLEHIRELLALLPEAGEEVLAAVWFHDLIYDRRGANEERSADVAHEALIDLHFPREAVDRVTKMILATRNHDPGDLPAEATLFLDADLAILGSPRERYRAYAEAIRFEYSWVPDEVFRTAREGVLRDFLAKPRLYRTDVMRERFEGQARDNMVWELRGFLSEP